jgi:uncharacterized ferritin-like protein (DUF455 family)
MPVQKKCRNAEMDKHFQQWHDAERTARGIERRLMIAQALLNANSMQTAVPALLQQLAEARAAADSALEACLARVNQKNAVCRA